jgi:diguanylate cyclase (GGDEF)-like protein/PAS domain S-box-containing protein
MSDAASPADLPAVTGVVDEQMARAIFDLALDGIVVLDSAGRLLAYNASFLTLWSFPPDMLSRLNAEEMRAHTAQQLAEPTHYLHSLESLMQADRPQIFDELALLDGRVFERHVSPLALSDGRRALVVRWRDISARRQAEQALARSHARLSAVVEHALNAILLASDDGSYVDANPAACAMTGYTRDELLAMHVSQLVVPDSLDLDAVWAGFLLSGSSRGRIQLRHKDGSEIVAAFSAKAQVLPGLDLSILSDVTEEMQAQQRLESLAQIDPLTGISNRRHFLSQASDELARARRHGQPLALLMIDLDHFKEINDHHGHACGDEVLRRFVQAVRGEVRQGECFARLGGDEFVLLLPQTDLEGATTIAQRLLQLVREHPAASAGLVVHFTASVGVAALTAEAVTAASIDELMRMADQALYRSKAAGRGRVNVDASLI